MNDLVVIQSAQGLVKYLLKCFPSVEQRAKGVVFGYDGRYNSKRFVLNGHTIYISSLNAFVPHQIRRVVGMCLSE